MFKKYASISVAPKDLRTIEELESANFVIDADLDIEKRMSKFAQELKVIAPQAKDFLYFTCVMMHAAEAACVNDDGSPKKLSNGEMVTASWEKVGEGVKWVCNDPTIKPYRNNNRDIFPEAELKVAYRNWVGRPLCLDHQSQSVDKIRGVIVDTVYEDKKKRVIALCALDAKNYADLADKVRTGVANNVSMGTAVGRAVCSDCHTVARTERDFCQHMRAKNCYGEINLDLSPIELSLVVSGADPKAKVKHIIASDVAKAAALLTDYLQLKEASKEVSTHDLESIKESLESLTQKIESISRTSSDDKSDAVGPTRSKNWAELDSSNDISPMNVPEAIPSYASELQRSILGAQTKLASLQENLLRLSGNHQGDTNRNEEPTMTTKKAYFQGTEEPKPGEKQYPVDPLNEKARLMDKNLHGPAPFPNVGPVDGSYPGDEKVKEDLQRLASEHERAMFREAALKKAKEQLKSQAFFQGTVEPKPGQTTYKPDPLNEKDRMEDKQMVGQKPFPEVGKIDGLYGDDEKEKEKLLRASVRATFEKVAQPDGRVDKGASRWVVYAGDKAILSATVDQITKGNSNTLYDTVATKRFGLSILNKIQSEGFHSTAEALLKSAQGAPPPPAPPAAPPADAAPPAPTDAPPTDDLTPPKDVGGSAGGEPKEIIEDLTSLMQEGMDKIDDLKNKIEGPVAEDGKDLQNIAPAGDESFQPPEGGPEAPKTASELMSMRKRVNSMLQDSIRETIQVLGKHVNELGAARRLYKEAYSSMSESERDYVNELTIAAVKDARAMLIDTAKLEEAVVKYAYGTAELEKRATVESSELQSLASDIDNVLDKEEEKEDKNESSDGLQSLLDELDGGVEEDEGNAIEIKDVDASFTPKGETEGVPMKGQINIGSKEDRANARVKLAQKGLLGFNELSNQAHPGGSVSAVDAANLDVKPTAPFAAFHVPKDIKDEMLEVANMPPRVRKQAEMIQQLVSQGRVQTSDVDDLGAYGVDSDAIKYWKQMFGQGDSASKEFGNKLVSEHASSKTAEEMQAYKGRVKRSYELATQMLSKGLISEAQMESQVTDIMKWNDDAFTSFKSILAKQEPMNKQASVPFVGMLDSGAVILPSAQGVEQANGADIKGFFDSYFAQKGLKF